MKALAICHQLFLIATEQWLIQREDDIIDVAFVKMFSFQSSDAYVKELSWKQCTLIAQLLAGAIINMHPFGLDIYSTATQPLQDWGAVVHITMAASAFAANCRVSCWPAVSSASQIGLRPRH